jgi:hypothetical protein
VPYATDHPENPTVRPGFALQKILDYEGQMLAQNNQLLALLGEIKALLSK